MATCFSMAPSSRLQHRGSKTTGLNCLACFQTFLTFNSSRHRVRAAGCLRGRHREAMFPLTPEVGVLLSGYMSQSSSRSCGKGISHVVFSVVVAGSDVPALLNGSPNLFFSAPFGSIRGGVCSERIPFTVSLKMINQNKSRSCKARVPIYLPATVSRLETTVLKHAKLRGDHCHSSQCLDAQEI